MASIRNWLRGAGLAAVVVAFALGFVPAYAQPTGPVKIGILHSLSGTMAISETTLKDVTRLCPFWVSWVRHDRDHGA